MTSAENKNAGDHKRNIPLLDFGKGVHKKSTHARRACFRIGTLRGFLVTFKIIMRRSSR